MTPISYEAFDGFRDFYLEDSFVLVIHTTQDSVTFVLSAVLTESHPRYLRPAQNSQYCFRLAKLQFCGATSVRWIEKNLRPSIDERNEVDYGNIDVMFLDNGEYHLNGTWGELCIVGSTPTISLLEC